MPTNPFLIGPSFLPDPLPHHPLGITVITLPCLIVPSSSSSRPFMCTLALYGIATIATIATITAITTVTTLTINNRQVDPCSPLLSSDSGEQSAQSRSADTKVVRSQSADQLLLADQILSLELQTDASKRPSSELQRPDQKNDGGKSRDTGVTAQENSTFVSIDPLQSLQSIQNIPDT